MRLRLGLSILVEANLKVLGCARALGEIVDCIGLGIWHHTMESTA